MKNFLLSFLLFAASALPAYCSNFVTIGGVEYYLNNTYNTAWVFCDYDISLNIRETYYYGSYTIPEKVWANSKYYKVTSISDSFAHSDITSLTLPTTVTELSVGALSSCSKLESISLPSTMTKIGNSAFSNCSKLTSITLPRDLETLGSSVFNGCTLLSAIEVEEGNQYFKSIDGVLYNYEGTELLYYPAGKEATTFEIPEGVKCLNSSAFHSSKLSRIVLPESVDSLGTGVFSGCKELRSVNLPTNLKALPGSTFFDCTSLTSITLPNNLESIGYSAFSGCTSLGSSYYSFSIPSTVTSIGSSAFSGCTSLTRLWLPSGVTSISYGLFQNCTALTEISIPSNATKIESSAFQNCTSLESIYLSARMDTISPTAFKGCTALASFTVSEDNPKYAAYDGILYDKQMTEPRICPVARQGKVRLPATVKRIGAKAFSTCQISEIELPDGIVSIGDEAFRECLSLTKINLPSSIEKIGYSCFQGCSALQSINLPIKLTDIPSYAFENCTSLQTVHAYNNIQSIGFCAFDRCEKLCSIVIPDKCTYVDYNAFLGCKKLRNVYIPDNEIYLTGWWLGGIYNYHEEEPSLTTITLPRNAVLDYDAFAGTYITHAVDFRPTPRLNYGREYWGWNDDDYWEYHLFHPEWTEAVHVLPGCKEAYLADEQWAGLNIVEDAIEAACTPVSEYSDIIYAPSRSMFLSGSTDIEVRLKNSEPTTAFEFRLILPRNVDYLIEEGEPIIQLTNSNCRNWSLITQELGDGSLLVAGYMPVGGKPIPSGDSELLSIGVKVDQDALDGMRILFEYIEISPATGIPACVEFSTTAFAVTPFIPGDIDADGELTIADVSSAVSIRLNNIQDWMNIKAADFNKSGEVTISDIAGIVGAIMAADKPQQAAARHDEALQFSFAPTQVCLVAGEIVELPVVLRNSMDATAMQFDLTLPDGVSMSEVTATSSHLSSYVQLTQNTYRVLTYSMQNNLFEQIDDVVLTLSLSTDPGYDKNGNFLFSDIEVTDRNLNPCPLEDVSLGCEITGIGHITGDASSSSIYYDMMGRRHDEKPSSGIDIINHRIIVK